MKLSEYTMAVLKNFSTINSGLVLNPGTLQRTMSPEKSVLVEAELDDSMPIKFGIYDLNLFLGNISTLSNPEVTFTKDEGVMSDGTFTLNFKPCSPELIISPPDKSLSIDEPDAVFDLSSALIAKILRLASMNTLPFLSVSGNAGGLFLQAHDKNNSSANYAKTRMGDWTGTEFNISIKTENVKMIPDDYLVEVKTGKFAKFTSRNRKLVYFVALETK